MEENSLNLSFEEARVLGCLIEKEATTPDAYPLTLNSLLLGCNQKTNRHPVVEYEEDTVAEAVDSLRTKRLVYRIDMAGSRVGKYRHNIDELIGLSREAKALLAVLLLRGPQTLGELRTRCERMFSFATTRHVEEALEEVMEDPNLALWEKMPRAPGQKEERYRQLMSPLPEGSTSGVPVEDAPIAAVQARNERIAALETELRDVKTELASLRSEFETFKQAFE